MIRRPTSATRTDTLLSYTTFFRSDGAPRADARAVLLHRVGELRARRDDAARRVDVHIDVLLRILRFEEQELGGDQRRHMILDLAGDEDDPFAQQARENVEAAFAAARLFDDDGNKRGARVDH